MSADSTEAARKELVAEINAEHLTRQLLEERYGQVWNTDEVLADFTVLSFANPFISVVRKSDGQKGSMMFQHRPRFYFSFTPVS